MKEEYIRQRQSDYAAQQSIDTCRYRLTDKPYEAEMYPIPSTQTDRGFVEELPI